MSSGAPPGLHPRDPDRARRRVPSRGAGGTTGLRRLRRVAGHPRLGARPLEQATKESTMSLPQIVSRDEWLAARKELLAKEKELTRRRDALSSERRNLPMVEIDKEYVFQGPDGDATLLDLFDDRLQLMVQHFMFDPSWADGCPGCTAGVDELAPGLLDHLH